MKVYMGWKWESPDSSKLSIFNCSYQASLEICWCKTDWKTFNAIWEPRIRNGPAWCQHNMHVVMLFCVVMTIFLQIWTLNVLIVSVSRFYQYENNTTKILLAWPLTHLHVSNILTLAPAVLTRVSLVFVAGCGPTDALRPPEVVSQQAAATYSLTDCGE